MDFLDNLTNLSVPTRYPDNLETLLKDYREELTKKVVDKTKELVKWLKNNFL